MIEEVIHSDNFIITKLLRGISFFYSAAVKSRNYLYDKKIIKSYRMPHFCISVGNITAGGTGKTPFVIYLANMLKENGIKVGVITNGYKSKKKGAYLVSDGNAIYVKPPEAQDEAYLIAAHKIPVACGSNRLKAAALLGDVDCIILDDGFQYRKVNKDIEILILGEKPFDNNRLLPAGLLREQPASMKRASLILSRKSIIYNETPVFSYELKPLAIVDANHKKIRVENLPTPIFAICGIGNPNRFFKDLSILCVKPEKRIIFNDHHAYNKNDIKRLKSLKGTLITTEKDSVKLKLKNLYILTREVIIKPDISTVIISKIRENE